MGHINAFYNLLGVLLVLVLTGITLPSIAVAQQYLVDWGEPVKEGDYLLYTRFSEGSEIKEVKLTGTIHANLKAVTHVLETVPEYMEWVYNCQESRLVSMDGPEAFTYYIRIDFPFPLSDRDVVLAAHHGYNPDGSWHGSTHVVHPASVPVYDGVVRVKMYHVTWDLTPVDNDEVAFVYTVVMDPGGYIPQWITNLFLSEAPVRTIKDLEKHSQKVQKRGQ